MKENRKRKTNLFMLLFSVYINLLNQQQLHTQKENKIMTLAKKGVFHSDKDTHFPILFYLFKGIFMKP